MIPSNNLMDTISIFWTFKTLFFDNNTQYSNLYLYTSSMYRLTTIQVFKKEIDLEIINANGEGIKLHNHISHVE